MNALDRRRLLTSGAAAAVLAASGLGARAAPVTGGTLRLGLSGGRRSDSWDGLGRFGTFMKVAGQGCIFDCLTEIAPDGTLQGELAERWESDRGARRWVFGLRRGVTFHDGLPFGPDDVVATLRRHLAEGPASCAHGLLADVIEVRRSGPFEVTFELSQPNVGFPFLLADPHLIIHPARGWQASLRRGNGTGLYRLREYEAGVHLVADRVPGHWKGDRAGWFDRIEVLSLPGRTDRLRALVQGRVDVIDDLDPHAAATVSRIGRMQVVRGVGPGFLFARAPRGLDPVTARALVDALADALPRKDLLAHVLADFGQIASDAPFGPADRHAVSPPDMWDPERGRAALARLDLSGLPLRLPVLPGHAHEALQASLLRAGLSMAGPQEGGLALMASTGRSTEDWVLSMPPTSLGAWVTGAAETDELAGLQRAGRAATDSSARGAIYAAAADHIARHGTAAIPVRADFLAAAAERLTHGPKVGVAGPLDNHRIAERWWFV